VKNPSKQRARVSRKCGEHAHHELRISFKKLAWAEHLDNDPMDFITHIETAITCVAEDREEGPIVGEISAALVEVDRALRMNQSLYDIFDSYSHTWQFYEALTGEHDNLTNALEHYTDGLALKHDLLLLDTIQIEPSHRGNRLGLFATASLIEQFREHCGLVMCQPYPMQFGPMFEEKKWRRRYGAGLDLKDEAAALTKVQDYWRELGFREIGKTGFMLMSPDDLDEAGIIDEMTR
jgi:hypothetical protein